MKTKNLRYIMLLIFLFSIIPFPVFSETSVNSPSDISTLKKGHYHHDDFVNKHPSCIYSHISMKSVEKEDGNYFRAGDSVYVTVILRDKFNNPVSNYSITEDEIIVPGMEIRSDSEWTEGDITGKYTAIYIAQLASHDYRAKLKIRNWNCFVETDRWNIIHGYPAPQASMIKTEKTAYSVGDMIKLSIEIQDSYGNELVDQVAFLNAGSVIVPNADIVIPWKYNKNDSYVAFYRANFKGNNLNAILKLPDWEVDSKSESYSIK